ncbi:uncharacterized protein MKK02DRAFT_21395 [Dioszegia hungarica]|uniref:protein-tyrosine-phosphatase n=1 Tax=Dioszegia hungarica TaxID=4972 RepID=A0AA38LS18_9TREE|nr:uncharacterized protein MKK02DRAFT_21395 [Dioszegia hungarica]KAI9632039.1 hypothetical protein MKK02DRAFT_21395 [Dioszegia hungarica]
MPTRSKSTLTANAPYDAAKPDDEAVDDVIEQVEDTGSLERAARKLGLYAKLAGYVRAQVKKADEEFAVDDDEDEDEEEDGEGEDVAMEMKNGDGDRSDVEEVIHLQEIVGGLWVGDLVAAMDSEGLDARGITNIVSLLRPRLSFPPHFSVFALEIDDSPDTDILSHLPTCVSWIGEALRKRERALSSPSSPIDPSIEEGPREPLIRQLSPTQPGGVLIHCQAGMSRSATVASAYLMTALSLPPSEAVDMVRLYRPVIDPSETFLHQLGLFHSGDGKVTLRDRSTRHFYMERNATSFMNGQTSSPAVDKMAKYPATPTPSAPASPMGGLGRRKIRCRTCRRFLAVREHMMDHILDQAPVSRPRTPSNFSLPAPLQMHRLSDAGSRRGSAVSDIVNPLTGLPGARSRQPSMSSDRPNLNSPFSPLTPISPTDPSESGSVPFPRASTPGLTLTARALISTGTAQSLSVESPGEMTPAHPGDQPPMAAPSMPNRRAASSRPLQTAEQLASRLPPHLQALRSGSSSPVPIAASPMSNSPPSSPEKETAHPAVNGSGSGSGSGMLSMTPTGERRGSAASVAGGIGGFGGELASTGTPILVNPRCSGYFVEPLTWMEPVLRTGNISGKLICPNEKCGAKIGNFDWAGVQCGCKEWVTPGFCISRSKVDEVW